MSDWIILIPVSSAAFFVNVIAPSVGMSGLAVFAGEARKRGYSPGRATTASILVLLFDYLGFFCFLVFGFLCFVPAQQPDFRRDRRLIHTALHHTGHRLSAGDWDAFGRITRECSGLDDTPGKPHSKAVYPS